MAQKTVLEVLKQAAGEIGISEPTAYSSNNQLLRLFYSVLRELRDSRAFPQQKRTHTITFTASRAAYPLPEDLHSGLLGSGYDRTNTWALVGPLSDSEWNYRLYEVGASNYRYAVRIFGSDFNQGSATAGGQLKIDPAPESTDTIGFDYISKTTILPPAWTASTLITQDHYRNANGNIYQATVAGTTGSTPPIHTSGTDTDGGVTWTYISAPKETISVDGDLILFDEDVIVQGMVAAFNRRKKFPSWQSEYKLFRDKIDAAVLRWMGTGPGTMGRRQSQVGYRVQPGGWDF